MGREEIKQTHAESELVKLNQAHDLVQQIALQYRDRPLPQDIFLAQAYLRTAILNHGIRHPRMQ